jgi:PAS domain S-box-containing protein
MVVQTTSPLPGAEFARALPTPAGTDACAFEAGANGMRDEYFRELAENVPVVMFTVDAEVRNVLYVNSAFEAIWRIPAAQVYERPAAFFEPIVEPDRARFLGAIARARGGGHPDAAEFRLRIGDDVRWMLSRVIPLRNERGEVHRIGGFAVDITERRHLEEQTHQTRKLEAVAQLAAGVAHDFNNLLTVILSYTAILIDQLGPDHALRHDVDEIKRAGERAATLTRQLLAFGRQQTLQPRRINLNEIVAATESMVRRVIGDEIALATVLAPDVGDIVADPGQIEQVIINLAMNARDAMPRGGTLTIETLDARYDDRRGDDAPSTKDAGQVILAVTDTGVGMDEPTQSHLFEPFFTTKSAGRGIGLGLATVHGIVQQCGGTIQVVSEPGSGTAIRICFPRAVAESTRPTTGSSTTGPHRAVETILLVEEDARVRAVAAASLRRYGYRILEVESGTAALRTCEQYRDGIQLMVTDIVLPELGGRELAERARRFCPGLKVLFMSGYSDRSVVSHALLGAGTAFIEKPVTPERLARRVREVLDAPGVGAG